MFQMSGNTAEIIEAPPVVVEVEAKRSFGLAMLARAGLAEVAAHVCAGRDLLNEISLDQRKTLVQEASLPLLLKLIELRPKKDSTAAVPSTVRCRPVTCLPLGEIFEQASHTRAEVRARELTLAEFDRRVDRLLQHDGLPPRLFVALDRWSGRFGLDAYLSVLGEVSRRMGPRFVWVGPSTAEIRVMLQSGGVRDVDSLLTRLTEIGVRSIEGGFDREILAAALRHKFAVAAGQPVILSPGATLEGFLEDAVNGFEYLRQISSAETGIQVWFPWSATQLDRGAVSAETPLAGVLVRLIALARLFLPEVRFIRAPITLMGVKAAHVAVEFGANDLGYVAFDSDTAVALGVARWSELSDTFARHGTEVTLA